LITNNIWLEVQIMKLYIMKFPSDCGYFLHVRCKHALQHPVLNHPKPAFFT
jgi:hypothetical protein